MKNYDERIESIFRKYDEKIEAKRRKSALIRRTAFSVSGVCAAVIVGIFVWKMPNRTNIPNSDLVLPQGSTTSVTVDATAANTTVPVTTSGRVDTTSSANAASTTAKKAETTVRSTAITEKASATNEAATSSKTTDQTAVSVRQSTETTVKDSSQTQAEPITTAETTIKEPTQTQTEPIITNNTETTSIYRTTAATTEIKIDKTEYTTAAPVVDPNSSSATSMTVSIESNRMDQFSITCMEKRYSRTGMTVTENDLNEKFFDDIVIYDDSEIIRNVNLKLFGIKELSQDYMIAAQIDNEEIYHLFRGGYKPDTIQSVFRTMALKKYWHIDSYIHKNDTSQNGYIVDNINDTAKANIFDILLDIDNRELKRGGETGTKIMTLYLESEFLGATEVSFTENGYIVIRFDRNIYTAFIESGETEKIIKSIIMEA